MGKDPLAEYRRERWQRNNMEPTFAEATAGKPEAGNQEPSFVEATAGRQEPLDQKTLDATQAELQDPPLTEHQALGMAIDALNEIPNRSLKGEYFNTYKLLPVLGQAYENGKVTEQLRDAAPDLLDALKMAQDTMLEIAPVNTSKYVGLVGDTLATIQSAVAKATPAPAPKQEVTREVDIDLER